MIHHMMRAIAGSAALAGYLAGAACAQDRQAEWQKTVAEAEKEGTILLNLPASNTQREFLTSEWPKAFPKIRLIQDAGADGTSLPKIRLERSTGKFLHDVALTGSITAFTLKNEKIADPVIPEFILPDVKDPKTWGGWDKVFYDNEHQYVFEPQIFLKMPFYNAKLLSPEKVKRMGAKVLLDPSLKGKIIWHDPLIPGSGETFAPVLRKLLGDDGLRTLVQEQVVFTANMMDMVDKMARGNFVIGMGPVMTQLLARYRKAGVDLDIRPLGNTPEFAAFANTGGANMVIFNNRPHPNATKVFLNWFASKDISARLAKAMGQDSSRVDVPPQVDPAEARIPGVAYDEPTRERNTDVVKASHEYIRQLRRMN